MEQNPESTKDSSNILQKTYKVRWRTYRNELKHCQTELTEKPVHDLRVATRRLLALINLLRTIPPHHSFQKLRRILKNQLNDFNDLRDTQVMLEEVSTALEDLPEIEPFKKFLEKKEWYLTQSTAKAVNSFKYSALKKRMDTVRKKIMKQKQDEYLEHQLHRAADDHFENVMRRYQHVNPAIPASIHRMRVVLKNFRYMVEIVHPLMPEYPQENLKRMHDFQGMMGDIQDVEVLLSTFEGFSERDTSNDPKPILRYYQERYNEYINTFIKEMQQVNTFWRAGAESPFPWEIDHQRGSATSLRKPAEPPPDGKNENKQEQA